MRTTTALVAATILAATAHGKPDQYQVRVHGRVNLAGPKGYSTVMVVAEIKGDVTEENYCVHAEFDLGDGTKPSSQDSDCPAWDDYLRQQSRYELCVDNSREPEECREEYELQRVWRFIRNYVPGDHQVVVRFKLGEKTVSTQQARFRVV